MSASTERIERIHTENGALARLDELVALLQNAVADGASIGFLWPLEKAIAEGFWRGVARETGEGSRALLLALAEGKVVGTIQLGLCTRPNGLHRAEVQKLMVHTGWRRRGIGNALMAAVEQVAREEKRTLLYLDTEPGKPAEAMYERLGWLRAGEIPGYACTPDGRLNGTAIFYRNL